MVLVQPPPGAAGAGNSEGSDWRTWVETPVPVIWANLIPNEPELLLRVAYYQSTIEGCARPGSQGLELDGYDIVARVTLMQPPSTPWAIPCHEQVVELDTVQPVGASLERGQTYRVIVNDRETTAFTLPVPSLPTSIAGSPIETGEIVILESLPLQYQLRVVSGMPTGSGCSQFNGYEIRRSESHKIDVVITHHQVADPFTACNADYPIVETTVPWVLILSRARIHRHRKLGHHQVLCGPIAGSFNCSPPDPLNRSPASSVLHCRTTPIQGVWGMNPPT